MYVPDVIIWLQVKQLMLFLALNQLQQQQNCENCSIWLILFTAILLTSMHWLPPILWLAQLHLPAERNVLGVIAKVGVEIGTEVLKQRRIAQEIQALLGGHQTHVVMNTPGGVRKGLTEDQAKIYWKKRRDLLNLQNFP